MDQRLKGRRIAALVADGFEKVELVAPPGKTRKPQQWEGARNRSISRCPLVKGGHSRRLHWPEAPALIFLRPLHP